MAKEEEGGGKEGADGTGVPRHGGCCGGVGFRPSAPFPPSFHYFFSFPSRTTNETDPEEDYLSGVGLFLAQTPLTGGNNKKETVARPLATSPPRPFTTAGVVNLNK